MGERRNRDPSTLSLTATPQEPITNMPRAQPVLTGGKRCQVPHIGHYHLREARDHRWPTTTCLPLPSHGATAAFLRLKSSQPSTCPGGSRAENSRKPCHSDRHQHQIMHHGPRYLQTPGARVLGPWAWEAAQHRTDPSSASK